MSPVCLRRLGPASYDADGFLADGAFHGEGLGDEVAEGIACVGPGGVGLIDFVGGGPGDSFKIADEFFALRVDEEAGVADVMRRRALTQLTRSFTKGLDVLVKKWGTKVPTHLENESLMMAQSVCAPEVRF